MVHLKNAGRTIRIYILRIVMETAKSRNSRLTGEIEFTRLPYNDFSNDIDAMPSSDVMYSAYIKFYDEKECVKCGGKWFQKKDAPMKSDVCHNCRKENLLSQNKDNL